MAKRNLYTNRLIREKSPYLLQHAHNPVDWYPWGHEAFEAAKKEDKPIFLSIGYATCHWCHTMEKESFENEQVADLLNEFFINIKVDREELPEVDNLYMEFAQSLMAGSAGWPLNLILTPDLKPFFSATYLPPENREGMMGLKDLVLRIREVWDSGEREGLLQQAEKVVQLFQDHIHIKGDSFPDKELVRRALELFFQISDPIYGGIKGKPKFPVGYQYEFLMRCYAKKKDARSLFLAERSLEMIHRGGIYDHLGGGFSRYSIDEKWMIPHFEKMLYDNALLADAYTTLWKLTKKEKFKQIAIEILDYVLKDMTDAEGGFYSAEDADSDGHEGLFYTWTAEEIKEALKGLRALHFMQYYGISEEGNFDGKNVLHTLLPIEEFSFHHGLDPVAFEKELGESRKILLERRNKRHHPLKDDKILTSWNGLMIYSLAYAGFTYNEPRFTQAAIKACDFLKTYLWNRKELFRRYRDGATLPGGTLDDYAFLIRGLIALYEYGEGKQYLEWALQLVEIAETEFKVEGGAFFLSPESESFLLMRKCTFSDGAEPSGNAVMTENLLKLSSLTGNNKYRKFAEDVLKAAKKFLDQYPIGYFYHLMNLLRFTDPSAAVMVIALNDKKEHLDLIKKTIAETYLPHVDFIWLDSSDKGVNLPLLEEGILSKKREKTTLYICHEGRCQEPVSDVDKMIEVILSL